MKRLTKISLGFCIAIALALLISGGLVGNSGLQELQAFALGESHVDAITNSVIKAIGGGVLILMAGLIGLALIVNTYICRDKAHQGLPTLKFTRHWRI